MVLVHQIIAILAFGEKCIGKQINHKNGNKLDNRAENLETVTFEENIRHAIETGLYEKCTGSNHGQSKLTEDLVREIRNDKKHNYKQLAEIYKVSRTTISDIRQGKGWKHVS